MNPELVTLGETMVLFLAEQSGALREAASFRNLAPANAPTGMPAAEANGARS